MPARSHFLQSSMEETVNKWKRLCSVPSLFPFECARLARLQRESYK
jgi:hypothetical protein